MKEIIIIETENSQKLKAFLNQEQINYQTYMAKSWSTKSKALIKKDCQDEQLTA